MNPLLKKAVIQNITLPVLMGAALFLSAGGFHFPRIWDYLIVVFLFSAAISAYLYVFKPDLLERRLNGMKGEKAESQKAIRRWMSLLLMALLVVSGLDNRFHASDVSSAAVRGAYVFILFGFAVYFMTVKENVFASSVVEVEAQQEIVTTGPYRIVRHPMYYGLVLILIGTPVALGSWWGLLVVMPLIGVIIARLKDEEKILLAQLPGYTDYCARTRYKLVPLVW